MVLLDGMIRTRRLTEFIQETMKIRNEELIDKTRWEYWLHRVFDMSFDDYLSRINAKPNSGAGTKEDVIPTDELIAIVQNTMEDFKDFCPS